IRDIAIGGGVSANSLLRNRIEACGHTYGWRTFLPPFAYTTDNAAMVGMAGYFKWQRQDFCPLDTVPYTRQGR
ncbi:MAG: tRNA (adenosine(37)-N6)-threonylcarbamoyltransferase complex transferase subunit TsaD, partial [Bacteroidales bacterium]|nr:tRNA (adenosine(37)-N6)-threonylcarbamoyltransferase complex transferase subunit TsaD [Bacteroidales bacterium]